MEADEIYNAAIDRCILCQSHLVFDGSVLTRKIAAVIGSDAYLGWTESFIFPPDRHRLQRVLVFPTKGLETSIQKPVELLLQQCFRRGCHHRLHRHLAMCFHTDCYNLLRQRFVDLSGQSAGPTMQEIWTLGISTLWLSVPSHPRLERLKVSLTLTSCSDNHWPIILKNMGRISKTESEASCLLLELYHLFFRLPLELQEMIITHAWCHPFFAPAVVLHQSLGLICKGRLLKTLDRCPIGSIILGTSKDIYVGRTMHNGIPYVSYLSNQPLLSNEHRVRLKTEIFQLRVTCDDFGIQGIEFLGNCNGRTVDQQEVMSSGRLWYKVIRPYDKKKTISHLTGTANGLFLQKVDIDQKLLLDPVFDKIMEWNTPNPPTLDPQNFYKGVSLVTFRDQKPARMKWIPVGQGVRGIIAAHAFNGLLNFHTWHERSDPKRIYEKQPHYYENIKWMFFPLGGTERISEVWVRQSLNKFLARPAILLRTTLGRSYTFGPYVHSSERHQHQFVLLDKNPQSVVSGFSCDTADFEQDAILNIGVACEPWNAIQTTKSPPEQPFLPGYPGSAQRDQWFVSSAPLTNIQSIYTCTNPFDKNRSYIGLLFTYRDQYRSVVGQWRWDFRIDKISLIDGGNPLICCRKEQGKAYAPNLKIEISAEKAACQDDSWERHPLEGEIIWWFSTSGEHIVFR